MAKNNTRSTSNNSLRDNCRKLAFYEKYLLTVTEASVYFHIGDRKMYELVHDYEGAKWMVRNGSRMLIKKDMFARWLDQQSEI